MNHSRYRLLQITVLAGLGFFFFRLINSGKLLLYINNRFAILSFLGMIVLFMLAANALEILNRQSHALENVHDHHDHEHHHSAANIFWLALPLALGLLIPVRPLGADAAANRELPWQLPW
jgi:uncharacterized membrane protein YcgQ (UPF0703/DUF1980 family)